MGIFIVLALLVAAAASQKKSGTGTGTGTGPMLTGGNVTFSPVNQYKDSNGVLWTIYQGSNYPISYRGVAGPGKYEGKTFTLPSWPVLKLAIDSFAQTQKSSGPGYSSPGNIPGAPAPSPSGTPYGVPPGGIGTLGLPADLGGFGGPLPAGGIPGMTTGSSLGAAPVATGASVPDGAEVAKLANGAETPIQNGERVTFDLVVPGGYGAPDTDLGTLEGTYVGPEDVAAGPARVVADRVAVKRDVANLPLGPYTIPASGSTNFHDRVARVEWSPLDPATVGYGASKVPVMPGSTVLVALSDRFLNKVLVLAQVAGSNPDGTVTLRLLPSSAALPNPVRVIDDGGRGAIVLPTNAPGNTVKALPSQLVDLSASVA